MLALAIHAQEGDKITGASVRVQAGRATGKVRGSGVERGYEAMEAAIPGNGKNRWMRTPWGGVLWLEPMQGWQEQSRKGRRMRQRGRKPTHDEQVRGVVTAIGMGLCLVVTGSAVDDGCGNGMRDRTGVGDAAGGRDAAPRARPGNTARERSGRENLGDHHRSGRSVELCPAVERSPGRAPHEPAGMGRKCTLERASGHAMGMGDATDRSRTMGVHGRDGSDGGHGPVHGTGLEQRPMHRSRHRDGGRNGHGGRPSTADRGALRTAQWGPQGRRQEAAQAGEGGGQRQWTAQ